MVHVCIKHRSTVAAPKRRPSCPLHFRRFHSKHKRPLMGSARGLMPTSGHDNNHTLCAAYSEGSVLKNVAASHECGHCGLQTAPPTGGAPRQGGLQSATANELQVLGASDAGPTKATCTFARSPNCVGPASTALHVTRERLAHPLATLTHRLPCPMGAQTGKHA